MPHAEYPSGSSCICKAFARYSILALGTDDLTGLIGGPLVQVFPPGSSRVEPGITPAAKETLLYSSWTQIAQRCGETRREGGMHFNTSVPDGEDLCESIGDDVFAYFNDLANGVVPENAPDVDAAPKQTLCQGD